MSVIGYVPVHIDASTRMEVRDGDVRSWLNLGDTMGGMHVHARAPEDAERLAEALTELARRMRERAQPMRMSMEGELTRDALAREG